MKKRLLAEVGKEEGDKRLTVQAFPHIRRVGTGPQWEMVVVIIGRKLNLKWAKR